MTTSRRVVIVVSGKLADIMTVCTKRVLQCQLLLCTLVCCALIMETRMAHAQQTTPPASSADNCYLPPDAGPCYALIPRYYVDMIERQCKIFTYGGCGGNANNFESEAECIQFGTSCLVGQGPDNSGWGAFDARDYQMQSDHNQLSSSKKSRGLRKRDKRISKD